MDQEPVWQTDLGGWCCAHRGRQRAGITEQPIRGGGDCRKKRVILLQLSCPWRVGATGREEEGLGKDIPQAFLAPDRHRGVREKGKGASQDAGFQQEHQDQAVSVCEELFLGDKIRPRAC